MWHWPAKISECSRRNSPRRASGWGRASSTSDYAESEAEYARLLWDADVVLSTAVHEFFGVSVVEAIYCGAAPVLPDRLSYPELIPPEFHARCLYDDFAGLLARLRAFLTHAEPLPALRQAMARFDWSVLGPVYDDLLEDVAENRG